MTTTSSAVFGSVTWAITDQLDTTLGGRFVRDEKKIDYRQDDPLLLLGGTGSVSASEAWSEFTPNFKARYRFSPDIMSYFTISKGFKSGGFNDALGDANGIAFDPETLWNYELGLKMELFDRRLVANVALFYMDWENIQITQDNPVTPVFDPIILNGGAAHSQGIEIEIRAAPTDRLQIGASLALLDAAYDEGSLPNGKALDRIPQAPDYTATVNAEYRWPIENFADVSFGIEYIARGESFLTVDNIEDGRVEPYGLLNARISFEVPGENWRFAIWGENLTDETYKTRLFDLYGQDLVGQRFFVLGDPRTFGVELRYSY